MSCFNNRSSSNIFDSCCCGNSLCEFDGDMSNVFSVPVYVEHVYDAVQFNLQGMKTVQGQTFTPAIPCGFTVNRVADIRTRSFFNPCNVDDARNLTVEMDTTLSGASFLQDCHGHPIEVIGPDGTYSQKILYADNNCCDEESRGTQIFGTQNVSISGNITVYIDLILCDNCNRETCFTVCAEVPVATRAKPMNLTNFFEICMPADTDTAFFPRFTELTCCASEARLATNNCGRDLNINSDGELCVNLIIALCVTAEKKVVAPVQMCVLSTGLAEIPSQTNTICSGFPSMFAGSFGNINGNNTDDNNCGCHTSHHHNDDCGCNTHFSHHHNTHHDEYGYESGRKDIRNSDCSCDDDCECNDHYTHSNCR